MNLNVNISNVQVWSTRESGLPLCEHPSFHPGGGIAGAAVPPGQASLDGDCRQPEQEELTTTKMVTI